MHVKKICLLALLAGASQLVNSQPLFTYGTKQVSKPEFLKAFNKNPNPSQNRKEALDEYLGLYIKYKLKVQAAYDEKLNAEPALKTESDNFKAQLAENIINDEANVKTLTEEAFKRAQKDLRVAHIFIEVKQGEDTLIAYKSIQKAYNQLKAGKNFGETVVAFSNDEYTKQTSGDLGYITVFTLPYDFENEIYKLHPGAFSAPYHSKLGYHIFNVVAERKAVGKRKVAQILINYPPNVTAENKPKFAAQADSAYKRLTDGIAFDKVVQEFSTDRTTLYTGGVMPEITVGQFNTDFEDKVFALNKVGEITKPFETSYGWHILKLVENYPVTSDANDAVFFGSLKQKVENGDRLVSVKKGLVKKWMAITKYKPALYDTTEFTAFSDSASQGKSLTGFKKIKPSTVLFAFEKEKVTAADWAKYIKSAKQSGTRDANKSYTELLKDFQNVSCSQYYREHLEDYNANLKQQCMEFDEANLLFAAMDKHVWGKAGEDSTGLASYYNQHKEKYMWQPGVAALVITTNNKELAEEVVAKLKKDASDWRSIVSNYGVSVTADSSRYELKQLPVKEKVETVNGFISAPEKNGEEGAYTFLYVTQAFTKAEQRNFDDARGMVINDYQQLLEEKWIAALKNKYPVKVNDSVWKTIK